MRFLLALFLLISPASAQQYINAPNIVIDLDAGAANTVEYSAVSQGLVGVAERTAVGQQYPGTWRYHTINCNGTGQTTQACYATIPSAIYTSMGGAAAFPLCSSTWTCTGTSPGSSAPAGPLGSTDDFEIFTPGLHKQVAIILGDSIAAFMVAGGTITKNGVTSTMGPYQQVLMPYGVPSISTTWVGGLSSTHYQDMTMTRAWSPPWSRQVINMSFTGWTLSTLAGQGAGCNTTRGAHLRNTARYSNMVFGTGQQVVFVIQAGTNDYDAGSGTCSAGGLYGSPTQGTPSLAGDVQSLISNIKALYSQALFVVMTPIARVQQTNTTSNVTNNQAFQDEGTYIAANMASVGANILINYHYVSMLDPANAAAVIANLSCYPDGATHPGPYCGQVYEWSLVKRALDGLQFGNARGLPANVFTVNGVN